MGEKDKKIAPLFSGAMPGRLELTFHITGCYVTVVLGDDADCRHSPFGESDNFTSDVAQNKLSDFLKGTMALLSDGIQSEHIAQNSGFAVGHDDVCTIGVDLILRNRRGAEVNKSVGAK